MHCTWLTLALNGNKFMNVFTFYLYSLCTMTHALYLVNTCIKWKQIYESIYFLSILFIYIYFKKAIFQTALNGNKFMNLFTFNLYSLCTMTHALYLVNTCTKWKQIYESIYFLSILFIYIYTLKRLYSKHYESYIVLG